LFNQFNNNNPQIHCYLQKEVLIYCHSNHKKLNLQIQYLHNNQIQSWYYFNLDNSMPQSHLLMIKMDYLVYNLHFLNKIRSKIRHKKKLNLNNNNINNNSQNQIFHFLAQVNKIIQLLPKAINKNTAKTICHMIQLGDCTIKSKMQLIRLQGN